MFYVSDIYTDAPQLFKTNLQKKVYNTLNELVIPFERVDTDEAITMEDCVQINKALNMKMVKTLFLCNRKKTEFYLFVTTADKPFSAKNFSHALGVSRVSFAPVDLMETMLGTKVGAATVFSVLNDTNNSLQIVFDNDIVNEEWYGCSDGTTTGYIKIKTADIVNSIIPYSKHILSTISI